MGDWNKLQTMYLELTSRVCVSGSDNVSYHVYAGIEVGSCPSDGTLKELKLNHFRYKGLATTPPPTSLSRDLNFVNIAADNTR